MRKLLLSIAAAGLLVACSKPAPAPEPVRAVRTMVVGSDSAGGSHEFAAEIKARTESRLGFQVGGKLMSRSVDLGSTVKGGQALAQLDPKDLRLGQEAARAAVASARANFEQMDADFKRYKDLRAQNFISAADLERRENALKTAKAQLDQAQAQAGVQVNQAAYATLVADAPGVITGVDADPGTVVAAGTPVLRLAHDGPRDAVFAVPEDQIPAVRALGNAPGALKVKLWGDARLLPATVREVAAAADPATRTFLVKADVGNAAVRLGQTATVVMDLPKTVGVMKLPLSSVMEVQGRTAVWLLDRQSMTVKPQPIQVAGAEGNSVLVSGGISPGQTVVTAGVHVLTPGLKVKFYVEPKAPATATAAAAAGTAVASSH